MTYASVVSADAPDAWWKFNETQGTSLADSGSGTAANLTISGSGTIFGVAGIDSGDTATNYCIGMPSSYGSVAMPTKLQFAGDFTIEAWVAFNNTTSKAIAVVSEAYAGDNTVRYFLGFWTGSTDSRKPSFGWYNGAWRVIQSASDITDTDWHHLVGTWDNTASQMELWVDGTSVAGPTTPGGTKPGGTETLYVGRRWDGNAYFPGYMDEVAMYAKKLSGTAIGNHYGAYNPAYGVRATQFYGEATVEGTTRSTVKATQFYVEAVVTLAPPPAYPEGYWGQLAEWEGELP